MSIAMRNGMNSGSARHSKLFTTDFEDFICAETNFPDTLTPDIEDLLEEDSLEFESVRGDIAADDAKIRENGGYNDGNGE